MAISVPLRRKRRPIAPHELKHDLSILFNLPSFKPAEKVLALAILSPFLLVSFVREVSREWLGKGGPRGKAWIERRRERRPRRTSKCLREASSLLKGFFVQMERGRKGGVTHSVLKSFSVFVK